MEMELSWKKDIIRLLRNRGKKCPLGLNNPSMSCYINSVLQCLTYSPPLANYCLQRKHLSTCNKSDDKTECPMCLLEDRIVRSLSEANVDSEAPKTITSNLKIFGNYLSPHEQTDAQEFLDCVINACEESEKSNNSPNGDSKILNKMFQSVQKTTKRCVECGNSSESEETVNYYPVPLSQPNGSFTQREVVIDLKENLSRYFTTEYLKDYESCENCKRRSFLIERSISKPPNVLLLTLQRFWVDKKNINRVLFPEFLPLTQYLTSPNPDERYVYSLYAIIVHQGIGMSSGHYSSYVKDANNCWFSCDDQRVCPVTIEEVLSKQQNVYILFYIRQTSPQDNGVSCNNSERPLSPDSSTSPVSVNLSNIPNLSLANIEPESISKLRNEARIMERSELSTTMCGSSSTTAIGSLACTVHDRIFKGENEGQGMDNMEGSEVTNPMSEKSIDTVDWSSIIDEILEGSSLHGNNKRDLSLSPISYTTHVSPAATALHTVKRNKRMLSI